MLHDLRRATANAVLYNQRRVELSVDTAQRIAALLSERIEQCKS